MRRALPWIGVALLAAAPLAGMGNYPLHLMIMCLHLGVRVYQLGADGTTRNDQSRPRRLSRHRRVRGGDGMESVRTFALAVAADIAVGCGTDRVPDRLPVFPPEDRRPLLCVGDPRPRGDRAHGHRGTARPDRRLAWRHAQYRARGCVLVY